MPFSTSKTLKRFVTSYDTWDRKRGGLIVQLQSSYRHVY